MSLCNKSELASATSSRTPTIRESDTLLVPLAELRVKWLSGSVVTEQGSTWNSVTKPAGNTYCYIVTTIREDEEQYYKYEVHGSVV